MKVPSNQDLHQREPDLFGLATRLRPIQWAVTKLLGLMEERECPNDTKLSHGFYKKLLIEHNSWMPFCCIRHTCNLLLAIVEAGTWMVI